MWGGPNMEAASGFTSRLLFSQVAASHAAIDAVGPIAGAAAREAVCVGGLIFFL